jgi:DNA-binding NarL/FixJ family response regulator
MAKIGVISSAVILREGLKTLLERELGADWVADSPESPDVAVRMAASDPAAVVVDFGSRSAANVTSALVAAGVRVLGLVGDRPEHGTAAALSAGAIGVVPSCSRAEEIRSAVTDVAEGRRHLSPALFPPMAAPRFALLSKREREVFMLLAKGLNNRQIGGFLFISPKTVETHRGKIYEKLNAHCVADIVHAAYRDGVLVV